ncbi:hypothetical protein LPJ61_007121, partial [Coemansia biformis]
DHGHLADLLFDGLSLFVTTQHGKYIVLVDNYDQPLKAALGNDWCKDAQDTYVGLIGRIFKGNENLKRGFLVGVHEFWLSSIGSGVNNIRNITLATRGYHHNIAPSEDHVDSMSGVDGFSKLFAFSRAEVVELVHRAWETIDRAHRYSEDLVIDTLTTWYGRYDFGFAEKCYNPVSVLGFLRSLMGEGLEHAPRLHWLDYSNTYSMLELARTYRSAVLLLAPQLIRDHDSGGTRCR